MPRATGSRLVLTIACVLAAAHLGCELVPDPAFRQLETSLSLGIVGAKRGDVAGSVDFEFRLQNRGTSTAKACLGPSRTVSYRTMSGGGAAGTFVDHPGCMKEFDIDSGDKFQWRETLDVPQSSDGRVKVDVQIVNPRRCGTWGNCDAFDLTSNEIPIP
jgi:hypothetical protein